MTQSIEETTTLQGVGFAADATRLWEGADFLEDGGGGIGVEDVDALDATTGGFDFFAANDLVAGPVTTFDKDIWKKSGDDRARSRFVEDEDRVDAFEAGEDFGALELEG